MKHAGTKRIETERLILRRFEIDDAESMYKNWASDTQVTKFLTWPTHAGVEDSKNIIELWRKDADTLSSYQWCIELKELGEPIGSIAVVHMDEEAGVVEIGYCIGRQFWGQCITTEAFDALINFFFEEVQVNRIEARHDRNNPASGRVMQKCGLVREGMKRQGDRNNTGICDVVFYGLLREEWERKST
jgi:ribosomal-protein-alanine N-acetyltransferase